MKSTCLLLALLFICLAATAQVDSYTVTPIVDNTQDQYLINPWGLSRVDKAGLTENEWWTSDQGTGFSTLYYANKTGSQSLAGLVVTIPPASGVGKGSPTGTTYNPAIGPGPSAGNFTFATLDGTISNWNVGQKPKQQGTGCNQCHTDAATIMVNNSGAGASYGGLTIAVNALSCRPTYYAANNHGSVEAYDAASFKQVQLSGTFFDPTIPSTYKPWGVQAFGSIVLVTFFNGNASGYVDAFDTNGNLKARLPQGQFSQPWGMTLAPANFGVFSHMLLVGNTTSGQIAAFDPKALTFKGFLNDANGHPIVIPGLWGLAFGNGNPESGPVNTLYFTAGGNYATGVFGSITAN